MKTYHIRFFETYTGLNLVEAIVIAENIDEAYILMRDYFEFPDGPCYHVGASGGSIGEYSPSGAGEHFKPTSRILLVKKNESLLPSDEVFVNKIEVLSKMKRTSQMNRTILFRGKREDNGKWVEGDLVTPLTDIREWTGIATNELNSMSVIRKRVFVVIPETVGQFTGILDGDGKKIFEGDIIHVYGENKVVEFDHAFWNLEPLPEGRIGGFGTKGESGHKPLYRHGSESVVIGSIHDTEPSK